MQWIIFKGITYWGLVFIVYITIIALDNGTFLGFADRLHYYCSTVTQLHVTRFDELVNVRGEKINQTAA